VAVSCSPGQPRRPSSLAALSCDVGRRLPRRLFGRSTNCALCALRLRFNGISQLAPPQRIVHRGRAVGGYPRRPCGPMAVVRAALQRLADIVPFGVVGSVSCRTAAVPQPQPSPCRMPYFSDRPRRQYVAFGSSVNRSCYQYIGHRPYHRSGTGLVNRLFQVRSFGGHRPNHRSGKLYWHRFPGRPGGRRPPYCRLLRCGRGLVAPRVWPQHLSAPDA